MNKLTIDMTQRNLYRGLADAKVGESVTFTVTGIVSRIEADIVDITSFRDASGARVTAESKVMDVIVTGIDVPPAE